MVVISYSGKEANAKIVYYGPGLGGKTTNLEFIYDSVPASSRGKMVSMKTQTDRTLFFDFLPLDLGELGGFRTRFLLYTVPGQVFYNATRKLVLRGCDAVAFIADSQVGKMEENKESLANLRANLAEYGLSLDEIPWVLQHNKRDLPNVYSMEELNAELNPGGKVPSFEAVATTGKGVFETFRGVSHLLMEKVTRDLRRTPFANAAARAAPSGEEHAAKGEPSRASGPAPVAPAWSINREAQETAAREGEARSGIDYGREISLPGESAPRLTAVAAAAGLPAAAPRRPSPAAVAPGSGEAAAHPAVVKVDAAQAAAGGITVPVTITRGATQEIVLRIVLKVDG